MELHLAKNYPYRHVDSCCDYYIRVPESVVEEYFVERYLELGFSGIKPTEHCDAGDYYAYRNNESLIVELEAYSSSLFLHSVDRLRAFNMMVCYKVLDWDLSKLRELGLEIIELQEKLDPVIKNCISYSWKQPVDEEEMLVNIKKADETWK